MIPATVAAVDGPSSATGDDGFAEIGIRAVCLDVDDTLLDHTASARAAMHAISGRGDAWSLWQRITDEHARRVISGELHYSTMHVQRTAAFFAALGMSLERAETSRREARRLQLMNNGRRLFGDTVPCLEWLLASGLRIAAVTNASGRHQRRKLAELGLAEYFDTVLIAGELGVAKPDPVMFHTACDELGVAPHEVAHVGDRLDSDAMGARDAGLHGVWLNRARRTDVPRDLGVSIIETLGELPELLVSELAMAIA
ncbi:MAG: HAD family hydrolase [Sciscionella sp.]